MKKKFVLISLLYFVCIGNQFIHAQYDSLRHYQMEGVVVTATRSETNTDKIGRSITVISESEIKNAVYQTVGDLLSRQEGIFVVGSKQTPGSIQNIFMRGANSNHTLVMIDGIRMSDPSTVDNALDLSELSLANVERIEIVRGSHSALYGSSAIGGAVNIITKGNDKPGFHANAGAQTAYFGQGTSELTQSVYANYTFQNGFYINTELLHSAVKGINAAIDTSAHGMPWPEDRDGFRKLDLAGKAGYKTEKWDIFASYKTVNQKNDLDRAAFVDDPNYTIDFKRDLWCYGAGYRLGERWRINFLGEFTTTDRTAINDSNIVDEWGNSDHTYFKGNYSGTLNHNEVQANAHWEGLDWVAGVGRYEETMSTKTFLLYTDPFFAYTNSSDLDTLGIHSVNYNAYLHADVNGQIIHPDLNQFAVGLGGRLDHHSAYDYNFTYDINPSYKLTPQLLIFASYATGFNAPSLYRLFTPERYYASDIQRGNKKLKPENSISYELGLKSSAQRLRVSASVFYTKVNNYIDYVYLWDKNIPIGSLGSDFMRDDYRGDTYLNIGTQITKGGEAAASMQLNSKLTLFGHIMITQGQLKYESSKIDEEKTEGNHVQLYSNGAFLTEDYKTSKLIRRPNTGNLGLTYILQRNLTLSGIALYTGKRRDVFYDQTLGPYGALAHTALKPYWSLDFAANYEFHKHWTIHAKAENVLNEKITEIRGFRNRGRGIVLSIRYSM